MNLPEPREEHIQKTIELSKRAFYESLETEGLTWPEFLTGQVRFIRKRWWVLQFLILALIWFILCFEDSEPIVRRETAVLIPVFAVLIVPELWRNVRNHAAEVENAACFTLRQIYAARLALFALADLVLLTAFFAAAVMTLRLTLLDIIVQFLIPLNVTACICLGILCGKRLNSEYAAIGFCLIWTGVWYRVISDDRLYGAVSGAVWTGLMLFTFVCLLLLGKRLLKTSQEYLEDQLLWN